MTARTRSLPDRHVRPRQRRELTSQFREQCVAPTSRLTQANIDFRRLHALHVLVVFGASGPAGCRDDFRL
jgi:hypothetical protein